MTDGEFESSQNVPFRIYFDLEKGHTADAAVVARSSLALIAGISELSYVLDPSLEIRVGISGYSEGSLWEDFVLLFDKAKEEYDKRPKRYQIALAALVWITAPPAEALRDALWEPLIETFLPDASDEDIKEAKRLIEKAQDNKIAAEEKRQFYREISRDTGISAVSANLDRSKPSWVVPRGSFPLYSGQQESLTTELDRRSVEVARLTIVSPVLAISDRRWKFATSQGEFGASVKDLAFLESIVAGRTRVRMRGGVELVVELEVKERLQDGVWVIVERNVLRVLDIDEPANTRQSSFLNP